MFYKLKSLLFIHAAAQMCQFESETAEEEWKKHGAVQEMTDPGPILELTCREARRTDLKLL